MSDDIATLRESEKSRIMAAVEAWEGSQAAFGYPAAARSIALNLKEFCNSDSSYPMMIADAAREASKEIARLRAELRKFQELHTDHGGL